MQLIKMLLSSVLLLLPTVSGFFETMPSPTPSPSLTSAFANIKRQGSPTTYFSIMTTEPPNNSYSIGMGQNGTGGNYYWASCRDSPFTTYQGYAGCGEDDLYTRCSGKTMWGIDGAGISCPISCGTHSIFRNTDDMSPTPMIACAGVTLDGLKLVRGDLRTTSSIGSTSGRGIAATTSSAAQSSGETGESGGTDNSASVGTSFGTVGVIAVGIAVPAISVMAGLTLLLL